MPPVPSPMISRSDLTTSARARRPRSWTLPKANPAISQEIAERHQVHPAVARILAARGWSAEGALGDYLSPLLRQLQSPFELTHMELAVARALRAVKAGEKICIYGDYDVDGVSSTALVVGALRFLGVDPMVVIPHRFNDGYGMNNARVEEIARAGCTLIITVDTGVTAVEQVRLATERGIDVIVTDHHLAGEGLPDAVALVNPNRPDVAYPHAPLCGVGVAFKFAHALLKESGRSDADCKAFLMEQLDLVALGTVADVVPLTGENRVFVRHGIEAITRSRRPGIRALLQVAGFADRPITPHTIGFGLGPRLNAAGRTNDATLALRLLLTNDPREAELIARQLDELNRERQEIERSILESSLEEVVGPHADAMPHLLVVGGQGWHLGVVGIVASRLTEMFEVPAIVLGIEENLAKGSARSVRGFDIHGALVACSSHLVTWGGHAGAAGLKLHASELHPFRLAINEHAQSVLADLDRTIRLTIDAEVQPSDITWAFYRDLQRLQPFGEGNPQPQLMLRHVRTSAPPRIVGKNHLKLRLRAGQQDFDAIGFGKAHLKELFESADVDIIFRAVENNFQGMSRLELELVDGRPAEAG
ncbi:single-stranded-DNA-specific exonuclease RecJ [bacterium]|nr:single-stranded-DNA-specific exonuclease RecJ [bacterium]